jgi:lipopolysaccharide transport system ATP-binding protein
VSPSDRPALSAEDLGKTYRRGGPAYGTLRDRIASLFRRGPHRGGTIAALDGVTFRVARGEVLGVVGRNGAGKSTLLKVLARVTPPDRGRAEVVGRLTALLELGAGFHPELTGRENALLQAAIQGLSRREARAALPAIAEFAGLVGEMEVPVKYFSTGMYARLGFSVAVHADPAVLLVDEVLGVGDAPFQQRCATRIGSMVAAGTAVLLVSHDLPLVERVAHRALVLEEGRVAALGPVGEALARYRSLLAATP